MPQRSLEEMPILRQLIAHVEGVQIPLHVPGHKQGRLLPGDFGTWLGAAAKLDLTELPGLDNLHLPQGCILESQARVARHYGARHCYYSVNGSTAAVMAALMAVAGEGGKVLFLNSPHLSAWRALMLADAQAVFAPVTFDPVQLAEQAPDGHGLAEVLQGEDFHCVFVTSPTYTGGIADVRQITEIAHAYGVPVIVDEAHGAHLGLVSGLPPNSVQAGADVVIHSVHKMLPGLTQTAWMLCQGSLVDPEAIGQMLSLLQSTSPSYLLLASLDAVQAWLSTKAAGVLEQGLKSLQLLSDLPHRLRANRRDVFRDWVVTGNLEQSQVLQREFAQRGVAVEYADAFGVLSIFGLDAATRELVVYRDVVETWLMDAPVGDGALAKGVFALLSEQRRTNLSLRKAYFGPKTWLAAKDAVGRLCAHPIAPYPPGVPVLWPGQEITAPVVEVLSALERGGYEVHGLGKNGEFPVFSDF